MSFVSIRNHQFKLNGCNARVRRCYAVAHDECSATNDRLALTGGCRKQEPCCAVVTGQNTFDTIESIPALWLEFAARITRVEHVFVSTRVSKEPSSLTSRGNEIYV